MPFEIQSGMTALEENKGGQKCLSVDNGSVCVAMEERQGNPRLRVPLLLILEDLDRVPRVFLGAELVPNRGKAAQGDASTYQMSDGSHAFVLQRDEGP